MRRPIATWALHSSSWAENDEALRSFDQALSLDPTLESVRDNRETLLEAMEENLE